MKAYVGQTRSRSLILELIELEFGECTQPREFPPRRTPWFLDNAAFSAWKKGIPFDAKRFTSAMRLAKDYETPPDFVVVPDKVAEGVESLEFSRSWVELCRPLGAPCYLAVQDGMQIAEDTISGFDGIFVGGTLEWKIQTGHEWVTLASSIGIPCHIGRVGTAKRIKWAKRIKADSIDSCLPLWSRDNLRIFVNALNNNHQYELF